MAVIDAASLEVARRLPAVAAGVDLAFGADPDRVHALYEAHGVATWDLRARRLVARHPMPRARSTGAVVAWPSRTTP